MVTHFLTNSSLTSFALDGAGWSGFQQSLEAFFHQGMGVGGAKGVGIMLMVVGIVMAGVSFAWHKINPQARIPSWGVFLVIAIVGGILMAGVDRPIQWLKLAGQWVEGLLGV